VTQRTRRIIFYLLFGLFFLIGATVILYAEGWRFDFAAWRPEKVGAIFIRSFPKDARITLDGKPVANQSGILSSGTLLSGLFPRTYRLALLEDGYLSWEENVAVLPSLVTELKYAVLVPQTPAAVSTDTVEHFFVTSGETVVQMPNNAIIWRETMIGRGDIISRSSNFQNVIMKSAAGTYSLYDFTQSTSTNLSAALANNGIDAGALVNLTIDPFDATKIIAQSSQRIWIYDLAASTLSPVARAAAGETIAAAPAASASFLAWTRSQNDSDASAVTSYGKFSKTLSVGSSTAPGRTIQLAWINNTLLGVLQNDGSLYLYDTGTQTFQKLADDVKDFAAADDGSAIAALEHRSVEILPFADTQTYHRFNLPDTAAAEHLIWYKDRDHLFVEYPDHVSFLDIDDLGLRNFVAASNGSSPLYNLQENILYLINSSGKLVRFDFPS
jgi:hypothetical protein